MVRPNPPSIPTAIPGAPRRILILGLPGSGKSTLARELSRRLGVPHIEADLLLEGRLNGDDRRELLRARLAPLLARHDEWIYEGYLRWVQDLVLPLASRVIRLETAWPLCLARLLARERGANRVRKALHFLRHHRAQRELYERIAREFELRRR